MKKSTLLFAIMSAGGIPYLASSKKTTSDSPASTISAPVEVRAPAAATAPNSSFGSTAFGSTAAPVGGARTAPPGTLPIAARSPSGVELHTIQQTFNFDVTPAWVLGSWSRVSTGLAELDLQGYRVALVTGTREGDLAGSLTYYFDTRQQLQRIVFTGNTGDARPLVAWLTGRYHLMRELTGDPSMYLYRIRDGKTVMSELRIKPADVVRQGESLTRFSVNVMLSRPEKD
jgi:hypothetical protein